MRIIWDNEKNKKLIRERGLSFDEFSTLILDGKYTDILQNPSRKNQKIFIVLHNGYTYVVPFVVDNENNIVLKTIFPSRKHHQLYKVKNEKN
ncbi:MAG: BrnT family toxin [Planctomycetaceae bacterium]|jgi:uncharacterized DUF497 family protein|nr:BrnT family toxin [Planctomycetaceae bacterium]